MHGFIFHNMGLRGKTLFLLLCVSGAANALPERHDDGIVYLRGEVYSTPCSIDLKTRDQTIELDTLTESAINKSGTGLRHHFTVHLIKCLLKPTSGNTASDGEYYTLAFDQVENNGNFAIYGNVAGLALNVWDAEGMRAEPGKPLSASDMDKDKMDLNYSVQIIRDGSPLRMGNYQSLLRFRMDYY
jgi:P pilus assembly protein, pilin FimA